MHIACYPGETGGTRNGKTLFVGEGVAVHSEGSPFLDDDIDTETGNSGGPVWLEGDNGLPQLAGIHVTELNGVHGRARVANAEFISEVKRMIGELGG